MKKLLFVALVGLVLIACVAAGSSGPQPGKGSKLEAEMKQ